MKLKMSTKWPSFLLLFHAVTAGIHFNPKPVSQDITDGEYAVLQCGIEPFSSQYNISWLSGGIAIKNNKRRFQKGNNLFFHPVDRKYDTNEFQCLATEINSGHEMASDPVTLHIKWSEVGGVELKRPSSISDVLSDMAGPIVLFCNITGRPSPKNYIWNVNNTQLDIDGKAVKINKKGRLTIQRPQLYVYDGNYTCCAEYLRKPMCTPANKGLIIKVLDHRIPRLIKAPTNQVVRKGSSAKLDCQYEAKPPPTIVWRRKEGNREFYYNATTKCKRRCVYANGTFVISHVKESSAGTYECFARQKDYQSHPETASVKIAKILPFPVAMVRKFVSSGRKFEYKCETPSYSLPAPDITWLREKDQLVIEESQSHVTRVKNTLVIDNVTPEDAGVYICVARNIAGTQSLNVIVTIGSKPRFDPLRNQIANEGSNFTWSCPVDANPAPTVTWYKDNSVIRPLIGRQEINETRLTLRNVRISDNGMYYCKAQNELNQNPMSSNPARLRVNGSNVMLINSTNRQTIVFPDPQPSDAGKYRCNASDQTASISDVIVIRVARRPQIVTPPRDVAVVAGSPVMLDCATTPGEQAEVTWFFGDHVFTRSYSEPKDRVVFPNGSLKIVLVQMDDSGMYRCVYERDGLSTASHAELTVAQDPPFPPNSPSPDDASETQMIQTIALSVSGGIAYVLITVALIVYCRRKHRGKSDVNVLCGDREAVLNGCNGQSRDEGVSERNAIPLQDLSSLDPGVNDRFYPASNIEQITVIGKGEFGSVSLSKVPGLIPDLDDDIVVMVKAFQPNSNNCSRSDLRCSFNREINLLHRAGHEGVVKLLAVSSQDPHSPPEYLITEYLEWGILKLCLNGSKNEEIPKFSKSNKMNMCCQLACGLEHLCKLGITHNDVATRNCVISSQLLVKISVLSLCREGFENEYYQYQGKLLPVRWMAPEALLEKSDLSPKSDVWSFGVTCWEIFTLAEIPYSHMDDESFISALNSDQPPSLPPLDGSKRITSLIKKCCHARPTDRPEMKQITRKLQSILASGDAPDDKCTEASALLGSNRESKTDTHS